MSSRSRYAGDIIARSTAVAMKPLGGRTFGIDPTIVARGLWLETHPLPTRPDEMGIDGATSRVRLSEQRQA